MLLKPTTLVFRAAFVLFLTGATAACDADAPLRSARVEGRPFSVDLAAQLSVPPPLVQPAALPGAAKIGGLANTELDREGGTYTWQAADEMTMELELPGKPRPHELRIRAQPFPLPDGTPQTITPVFNGEPLRKKRVSSYKEELSWEVPPKLLREGTNTFALRAGYALSPADVKPGARDVRTLAYRIYGISLAPAGRRGASGPQVELYPGGVVTLPIEGADGLQLAAEAISVQGGEAATLNVTLSVDGATSLEHAYRRVEPLRFAEGAAGGFSVPLPLQAGEAAMLQLEVLSESGASLDLTGFSLSGSRVGGAVPLTPPSVEPPPLVVLYVSDTTRADRLSAFGYARPTSPNMDALVRDGAQAWVSNSNSSWTRPSVATLFTGLEQGAHGVLTKWDSIPSDLPVLAESMRDAGYRTVAFSGSSHVQVGSGFARGFERFEDRSEPTAEGDLKPRIVHFIDEIFDELDQNNGQPLFLFVHSIGPHDPYQAPPEARQAMGLPPIPTVFGEELALGPAQLRWIELAFRDRVDMNSAIVGGLSALYDAEIWDEDVQIGRLIDGLKARGMWDRSLFVLTSDHGEEFGEHGSLRHGRTLWDEQVHVPLFIHWPEGAAPPHATSAGTLDLVPTITSITGADPIPNAQGRDLRAEPTPPRYWHAEVGNEKLYALWDDRYKLVVRKGEDASIALYDRLSDPAETHNVWASHPARVAIMGDAMDVVHKENAQLRRRHRAESSRLTETQEDRLRLLGYVDEDP